MQTLSNHLSSRRILSDAFALIHRRRKQRRLQRYTAVNKAWALLGEIFWKFFAGVLIVIFCSYLPRSAPAHLAFIGIFILFIFAAFSTGELLDILWNPTDFDILSCRPIQSRHLFFARLLLFIRAYLTALAGFGAIPVLAEAIWFASFAHMFQCIFLIVTVTSIPAIISVLLFAVFVKFFSGKVLEKIIVNYQIGSLLALLFLVHAATRFNMRSLGGIFDKPAISRIMNSEKVLSILGNDAVAVPVGVFVACCFLAGTLAAAYRLVVGGYTAGIKRLYNAQVQRPLFRSGKKPRVAPLIAGGTLGSPEKRAGISFLLSMMWRVSMLRKGLVPIIFMPIIMILLLLWRKNTSEDSIGIGLMFVSVTGVYICNLIMQSRIDKPAWVFSVSSGRRMIDFIRGIRMAILVVYQAPVFLIVGAALLYAFGPRFSVFSLINGMLVSVMTMNIVWSTKMAFPFCNRLSDKREMALVMGGILFASGIFFSTVHMLYSDPVAAISIPLILGIGACWAVHRADSKAKRLRLKMLWDGFWEEETG